MNKTTVLVLALLFSSVTHPQQCALVTGVSRGIGKALAHNLLDRGVAVVGISRSDVSSDLKANPDFLHIKVDITTNEGLGTIKRSIATYNFDYVVNNAGVMMSPEKLHHMSSEKMERVIQLNLLAPMKLSAIVIPQCNPGAKILNVTSRAATTVVPQTGPYCISKAGLNMLTGILREELKEQQIAVACVIPGEVDTEVQRVIRNTPEFFLYDKVRENYSEGKLVSPEVCAQFLSWLLCDISCSEFNSNQEPWEIYDVSHRSRWLQGFLPECPF